MKKKAHRLPRAALVACLFVAIMVLGFTPPSTRGETLRVGCGAGYRKPMMKIFSILTDKTGVSVEPVFGNMQQILAQAKASGTLQVLIGDKAFLEASSIPLSMFKPIGRGRLVLASSRGLKIVNLEDLLSARFKRIGIADERKAIYGKAAKECLIHEGLYESLQDKLLVSATVPQVSAYLVIGEVDAAFLNLTEALSIKERIGGYTEVDSRCYTPVEIGVGVVQGAEHSKEVHQFLSFLETDDARALLMQYGL